MYKESIFGKKDPFAFSVNDKTLRKEHAPNYIPPEKRKVMRDHLTRCSIKYHGSCMSHSVFFVSNCCFVDSDT